MPKAPPHLFEEHKHIRGPGGKFSDKPDLLEEDDDKEEKPETDNPIEQAILDNLGSAALQSIMQLAEIYGAHDTYQPLLMRKRQQLTQQQRIALRAYRKLFHRINAYHNSGHKLTRPSRALDELTSQIDSSLHPIGQDTILSRHVTPRVFNNLFRASEGDLFHHKGYTHASSSYSQSGDLGPYRMMVEVPRFVKAAFLEGEVPNDPNSSGVLMERDLGFRVLNVQESAATARIEIQPRLA